MCAGPPIWCTGDRGKIGIARGRKEKEYKIVKIGSMNEEQVDVGQTQQRHMDDRSEEQGGGRMGGRGNSDHGDE